MLSAIGIKSNGSKLRSHPPLGDKGWMSLPARIETGFDSLLFKRATKHAYDYWHFVQGCRSTGGAQPSECRMV